MRQFMRDNAARSLRYGCRVIQKALEAVSPEVQLELLKEVRRPKLCFFILF